MFQVLNNRIAIEPLGSLAVETTGKEKGFVIAKQKSTLASSRVVFAPVSAPSIKEGDRVYFRADETGQYLRHVYNVIVGDKEVSFVLMPIDQLQLVDRA
jgi:hypothetical protein